MTQPLNPTPLFDLGQVVATPGVLEACPQDYLNSCLERHVRGDWGVICAEDSMSNFSGMMFGSRIFSAYPINPAHACTRHGDNCLWIITGSDRRVTTFLLPSEY